jgi:hypothetical protein
VPIFQISQGVKGTQDDVYPVRRYWFLKNWNQKYP